MRSMLPKKAALSAISLLLALTLGEFGLRLFWPQPLDPPRQEMNEGGLCLVPGSVTASISEEFRVIVHANRAGHHDVDHLIEKPDGVFRIAMLGDSFLEAVQVPLEQNLCRLLESDLARRIGSTVEVINLGVAGSGTGAEYLSLREEALAYQPDLIVLVFAVTNDVYNNSPDLEIKRTKPFFELDQGRLVRAATAPQPKRALPTWLRASHAARLVARTLALREHQGIDGIPIDFQVYSTGTDPTWEDAWQVTEALLAASNEEARSHGGRFLVAVLPDRLQLYPLLWQAALRSYPAMADQTWDMQAPHRRMAEICERQALDCVDLLAPLQARADTGESLYFPYNGHLTALGHQAVADLLAEAVAGQR